MRAPDRRAMVERPGKDLSVRRQCTLLNLARSGVYRAKPITGADDLALMRRIDELHLELPFYGSRRMIFELNKEGRGVNRKRGQRLMPVMGRGAGSAPRHEQGRARTQDIPLPAARPGDYRTEPCVGVRHHLCPDGVRISVSRGDHRLG
jgi:putative transposase